MLAYFVVWIGCMSPPSTQSPVAVTDSARFEPVVSMVNVKNIIGIDCDSARQCTVATASSLHQLNASTGDLSDPSDRTASTDVPWPIDEEPPTLEEQWNAQVHNQWRSPFRAQVPSPSGGRLRLQRGLTPGTSRVVRLGGSVLTARQAPDPGHVAFPNALALHPTGAESYLVVWPNPYLIAFETRSMETTWRISLDGPAQGLFVSANGRYLVAETGGVAPEHQLLDYEPTVRVAPEGTDPSADQAFRWVERPPATETVLVDLGAGRVAARLPGPFVGLSVHAEGAIIASTHRIAHVRHIPTSP
mgnify:CR=1 FL=1